jgi:bifunctional DNase/RNase
MALFKPKLKKGKFRQKTPSHFSETGILERIHMEILGLSTSPSSGGAYALILNEPDGGRRLPIIIGTFEAQAIALELERIKPPRPMTHDLMRSVIQGFGSYVKSVFINELRDGTFFAQVILDMDGQELDLDSRPSDAIALAIRFDAPIYVAPAILDEAGIVSDPKVAETPEAQQTMQAIPTAEPASDDSRLTSLEKQLTAAVAAEDYERAARLRDEINRLKG